MPLAYIPCSARVLRDSTASSLNEMRLGNDELGGEVHTYCPAYTPTLSVNFWRGAPILHSTHSLSGSGFARMWRSMAPRIPTSVSAPD